jgi:hypothetical protein
MNIRFKSPVIIGLIFVVGFIVYRSGQYFFTASAPIIQLHGLQTNGSYAGNIQCILSGSDQYKVSYISVWLDDTPLINKFYINKQEFNHPFTISSQALSNDRHVLRVEAISGAYRKKKTVEERAFIVDNVPLQVAFVRPQSAFKVFQGRTMHVQFQVNKPLKLAQIHALSNSFDCFPESKDALIYEAFVPVSCEEAPNEYVLSIDIVDRVGNKQVLENKLQVIPYPFKKQALTVDAALVQQEAALGAKQKELEALMAQAVSKSPHEKLWKGLFCVPLDMTAMTCDFGTVRFSKDRGRYAHRAVDLGARSKSVIWAAQDGIVIAKGRYERSGNTIVLDHGHGVLTMYGHMDHFADISVGDRVEKGNPLGIMGKTGYATGEHLHWEMVVNGIQVDPMQWTKQNF